MLNIGFVLPTGNQNFDPFRNHPLTPLYLLTIIEKRFGAEVRLSLIDLRGADLGTALPRIPEMDVYLYSVTTLDIDEVAGLVKELRALRPKAKHIAGGPHVNIFPEESAGIFDAVALGEGEESVMAMLEDVGAGTLKPLYKQSKAVDVDAYPHPSRKYLPEAHVAMTGLLGGEWRGLLGTSVLFSRGCPFRCHFCANQRLVFGPVRYRSPRLVAEEIEYLKRDHRIEALALKDDNCIPFTQRVARPFLEAIGRAGLRWRGQSRANGVPPDMVRLAREAGCVEIAIGIESVSQKVLDLINKKLDLEEAKKYIALLHDTGIGVRLNLIIGLPGEDDSVVPQTLRFIEESRPTSVLLSLFCPVPGSEIYHDPDRFGILLAPRSNWGMYRTVFGRFDPDEKPKMAFEYAPTTPWGRGRANERILADYAELQGVLRSRGLNF